MRRGIATFTLDYGRCPPWLFERMVKLARIITSAVVDYYGPDEFLRRLSDPVWFQSFGSLLAFDWNASGLTTTTMGALKEAIRNIEGDLGLYIAGGKGKTSKKTPDQIISWSEKLSIESQKANRFVYLSKLTAKVDSALLQDGFNLYHHNFMFTKNGTWAVVQQGMNEKVGRARRYHWYSENIKDLTIQPHAGIQSEVAVPHVLNLTAQKSIPNRQGVLELVKHKKDLFYEIRRLKTKDYQLTLLDLSNEDFTDHPINRIEKNVQNILEASVANYEEVAMTKGVGAATLRALTLVSEVIFGAQPSYEDPIRYTYAFGGKDGIPYPINRENYDRTMEIVEKALKKSGLSPSEKEKLLRRNERLFSANKA